MIVKNLLAVGVIATTATVASAADEAKANWKVNGKIRMDNVQTTSETKPSSGDKTTTKSSELVLKRAQFTLTGDMSNGDKMLLKFYADKSGSSDMLENAYVTHKFMDNITADLGKMGVLAQSWETDYSSTDQYLYSWAGNYSPSAANAVQVNANFGDHNISLQAAQGVKMGPKSSTTVNGVTTDTTESFNNGGGLSSALQYRGEINKMIKPIVTYTNVKTSGTKISGGTGGNYSYGNGYQTQLGLGVQVDTAGVVADLEYDTVKFHKKKFEGSGTDPNEASNKDSNINSLILQAKYAVGMTTPFLKLTSESWKKGMDEGAGDMTRMAWVIGAEHKLDSVCRLHAAYSADAWDVKVGSSKTKYTDTTFNLGVTAAM